MPIQLTTNVRHNGQSYYIGDILENLSEKESKRLVELGDAFFIKGKITNVDPPPANTENEKLLNEFKVAYEYNELKDAAKEVGLDFPGNISFKDLVKLIIDNDKVEEFFED